MEDLIPSFAQWIQWIGLAIDGLGVAIIVVGALFSLAAFLRSGRAKGLDDAYKRLRENLGRTILLGLEFLVAGDIIRTVAVSPTYKSVGLLSIIILIRLFLSMQLEVEINGSFPWSRNRRDNP